jgi:Sec-independent protein secretion pathway component TatC
MFNVIEGIVPRYWYHFQQDFYIRAISYALVILSCIILIRAQVSEMNLLQLVPGSYLVIYLLVFFYIFLFGNYLILRSIRFDKRKFKGTKTTKKKNLGLLQTNSQLLILSTIVLVFFIVLPVSLDFFNISQENTFENSWSFSEIFNLERVFFFFLGILLQLPLLTLKKKYKKIFITTNWKRNFILVIVLSGIVTPTVDISTQAIFSASIIGSCFSTTFIMLSRSKYKSSCLSFIS